MLRKAPIMNEPSSNPAFEARTLSWTLANFRCSETAVLQVFLMLARIFARSRASPGPTKNSVYPYILGRFAHPPLQKLAKVKLRDLSDLRFPDAAKIVLVQDNLNTHKPASLYEAFPTAEARRLVERFGRVSRRDCTSGFSQNSA